MHFNRDMWRSLLTIRGILLLDGLGALVTAGSVGLLLPALEPWIGVPAAALHVLGAVAVALATFSLSRHFTRRTTPGALRFIALANLSYCAFTVGLLVWLWPAPTAWALAYFGGEIAIVALLASRELALARKVS